MTHRNPYIAGRAVGNTHAFVGREQLLRTIDDFIRSPTHAILRLYGQRRIGKTSILQALQERLANDPGVSCIYVDLQPWRGSTAAELASGLVRKMSRVVDDPPPWAPPDDLPLHEVVSEWVQKASRQDHRVVFLFDELESWFEGDGGGATPRHEVISGVLTPLTNVAPDRICAVFSLGRSSKDEPSDVLSMFKGAQEEQVSLLPRSDSDALVGLSERQGEPILRWSAEAREAVWSCCRGHALLTQQLCSCVWDQRKGGDDFAAAVAPAEVTSAVPTALERSEASLTWLWDGLTRKCRLLAGVLAHEGAEVIEHAAIGSLMRRYGVLAKGFDHNEVIQLLVRWDIVEAAEDGVRFRVPLIREWFRTKLSRDDLILEADRLDAVAHGLYEAGLAAAGDDRVRRYREALERNPMHIGARRELARELEGARALDEAIALVGTGYARNPAAFRDELVRLLESAEVHAAAEALRLSFVERILAIAPDHEEAARTRHDLLQRRAKQHLAAGDEPKAIEDLVAIGETEEAMAIAADVAQRLVRYRFRSRVLWPAVAGALTLAAVLAIAAWAERDGTARQDLLDTEDHYKARERTAIQMHQRDAERRARLDLMDDLWGPSLDAIATSMAVPPPVGRARAESLAAIERTVTKQPGFVADLGGVTLSEYRVLGLRGPQGEPAYLVKLQAFARKPGEPGGFSFISSQDRSEEPQPAAACLAVSEHDAWSPACAVASLGDDSAVRVTCGADAWRRGDREADRILCLTSYELEAGFPPLLVYDLPPSTWCAEDDAPLVVGFRDGAVDGVPALVASTRASATVGGASRLLLPGVSAPQLGLVDDTRFEAHLRRLMQDLGSVQDAQRPVMEAAYASVHGRPYNRNDPAPDEGWDIGFYQIDTPCLPPPEVAPHPRWHVMARARPDDAPWDDGGLPTTTRNAIADEKLAGGLARLLSHVGASDGATDSGLIAAQSVLRTPITPRPSWLYAGSRRDDEAAVLASKLFGVLASELVGRGDERGQSLDQLSNRLLGDDGALRTTLLMAGWGNDDEAWYLRFPARPWDGSMQAFDPRDRPWWPAATGQDRWSETFQVAGTSCGITQPYPDWTQGGTKLDLTRTLWCVKEHRVDGVDGHAVVAADVVWAPSRCLEYGMCTE